MLYIAHKLIPTPGEFSAYTVNPFFRLIPIIPGNVIAMHRAYNETGFGKSHLIQHETTAGVKGFAYNHRGFNRHSAFIGGFPRKKRIVTGMTGLVLADNG